MFAHSVNDVGQHPLNLAQRKSPVSQGIAHGERPNLTMNVRYRTTPSMNIISTNRPNNGTITRMTRICIIDNIGIGARRADAWLAQEHITTDVRHGSAAIPRSITNYDGFIILGGEGRAHNDDTYPWVSQLYPLVRQAVQHHIPTLGICLGAQIIAHALGGTVTHAYVPLQAGMVDIHATAPAAHDPLLGTLPSRYPMVEYHEDTITQTPQGATILATSAQCPTEAFRVGDQCWGLQYHPESSVDYMCSQWTEPAMRDRLERAGLDLAELQRNAQRQHDANTAAAHTLLRNFARITQQYAATRRG